MQIKERDDRYMHSRLPIGKDEKILGIYRHHWFAYASVWLVSLFVILGIMGVALFVVMTQSDPSGTVTQHKGVIFAGAGLFSTLVLVFSFVPVYLKSQEQVVLTEEALLQILQPSIFASKISQLNLQHIADVSVQQYFLGTILGYGKISVETPGEQDNYEFFMIPRPQQAAKEIIEAHENYQAALQAGKLPSTLGTSPQQPIEIDPGQYQQFLAYQQAEAAKGTGGQQANSEEATVTPQAPPQAAPSEQPYTPSSPGTDPQQGPQDPTEQE